jgi:hypothetical protein
MRMESKELRERKKRQKKVRTEVRKAGRREGGGATNASVC